MAPRSWYIEVTEESGGAKEPKLISSLVVAHLGMKRTRCRSVFQATGEDRGRHSGWRPRCGMRIHPDRIAIALAASIRRVSHLAVGCSLPRMQLVEQWFCSSICFGEEVFLRLRFSGAYCARPSSSQLIVHIELRARVLLANLTNWLGVMLSCFHHQHGTP